MSTYTVPNVTSFVNSFKALRFIHIYLSSYFMVNAFCTKPLTGLLHKTENNVLTTGSTKYDSKVSYHQRFVSKSLYHFK